ncbi:hypothetical protein [Paraburkholderia sp. RL18-085-BIA-A]|uniref:hypothetical protein n=1 Tax=Paraburkholderia sp. RL18-085-BIA-A TaxID=3031633 RepID=UPI0038BCA980
MSLTYFRTEDAEVTISDVGQAALADEQRHAHAEIVMWTTAASLIAIAGLVLNKIMEAGHV